MECLAAVRLRSVDLTSDPALAAAYQENKDSVRDWMKAFTSVEMTAANEAAHMLAQIQAFGLWFEVSCLRHADEMACDRWQEQFDYILSVAERYVQCQGNNFGADSPNSPGGRRPDSTRPGFTLGTALVNVVVIIAWKSRNSATRRRIMRLLRRINLAGVFDGDWLCALTSHIIEMEEIAAAQLNPDFSIAEYQNYEIPLEARILDIDFLDWAMPEFYKHEVGKVVYAYQDRKGIIQVDMTSFRVERTEMSSSLESSCSSSDTSPADLEALDMTELEYADSALLDDLSTWPATRIGCSDIVLNAT
ncbi:hypothetical protein HII31_07956 [Pseudocercospora fuligena]|uniref:Uncharacterized protein n=1 Tax=Pseudocercospora fuligena TaxID=685502 RepID=A0A8H6VHL6_9PEZI|nr:hypothetical protein HII31_07956 [Pseudocercospora fuligena]